jgi:hypothetical protein
MQKKVEFTQVRTFGEIVEDSIAFFKQNWKALLKAYFYICGFFWIASTIISIINQVQTAHRIADGETQFGAFYFFTLVFELVAFIVVNLTVLSFMALYKEKGNEAPTVEEVWGYVKYYFLRFFGGFIVLFMALILGFVFCMLPGIYLWPIFGLIFPIMVVENGTFGYAFSRSFQLIKGNWWPTFGIVLVTYIIVAVAMLAVAIPALLIGGAFTLLSTVNMLQVYGLAIVIVTHLFQFLYVIPMISIMLIYFNLTEQKEHGTLLERIMNLGKHDPEVSKDQLPPQEEY